MLKSLFFFFLQVTSKADKVCFKETNVPIFSAAFLLNSLRSWSIFQGSHRCTPQYACLHRFTTGLCDNIEVPGSPSVFMSLCDYLGRGAFGVAHCQRDLRFLSQKVKNH